MECVGRAERRRHFWERPRWGESPTPYPEKRCRRSALPAQSKNEAPPGFETIGTPSVLRLESTIGPRGLMALARLESVAKMRRNSDQRSHLPRKQTSSKSPKAESRGPPRYEGPRPARQPRTQRSTSLQDWWGCVTCLPSHHKSRRYSRASLATGGFYQTNPCARRASSKFRVQGSKSSKTAKRTHFCLCSVRILRQGGLGGLVTTFGCPLPELKFIPSWWRLQDCHPNH